MMLLQQGCALFVHRDAVYGAVRKKSLGEFLFQFFVVDGRL